MRAHRCGPRCAAGPSARAGSGKFGSGRRNRLGDLLEAGLGGIDQRGTVARARRRRAAAFAQEALDDAVFETVEGDDGEPAAGLQRALGRFEPLLQLVEFGVQMDADRLEGAGRRVALLARAEASARRTIAASSAVRSTGRAATMARAIARARGSSP